MCDYVRQMRNLSKHTLSCQEMNTSWHVDLSKNSFFHIFVTNVIKKNMLLL